MMRYVRLVVAAITGYAIVVLGLSLIVMTWWINESLPVTVAWILAMIVALFVCGWVAGKVAGWVAGEMRKAAVFLVVGLTVAILTMNILLDVAAEPLWFKLVAMGQLATGSLLSIRDVWRAS